MKIILTYSRLVLLLVCQLVIVEGIQAEVITFKKHDFSKIIQKEFNISIDGNVNLINRHGRVEIETWDKNLVTIEVRVTVEARNESDAQEVLKRINIDFSNDENYVKAETIIESKKDCWYCWGNSDNGKYSIDYFVKMPSTNHLDLFNKYGDSFVGILDASANVEVKYGNIRMEGINDDLDLEIGYGNATVVSVKDADVNLKYGKLNITEMKNLNIESKYSKVYLDKAIDINSHSKYDTYKIGDVSEFKNKGKYDNFEIAYANVIDASSAYADFDIKELATSAGFDLKYGHVNISGIAPGFAMVKLNGSYTDFKLELNENTDYHLDAVGSYAGIKYPEDMKIVYEKEQGKSHEVEGFKGQKNTSVITARLSYGGLKLE